MSMKLAVEARELLKQTYRAQARLERAVPWGHSYESEFILGNPMEAGCEKCGYLWVGRDAIRAPTLRNCSCFWCHGRLIALNLEAYGARLRLLQQHRIAIQGRFDFQPEAQAAGSPAAASRTAVTIVRTE